MRIMILNPPAYKNVQFIREGRCMQSKSSWAVLWPPLTLTNIAAVLREEHTILFLDATASKVDIYGIKMQSLRFQPDIAVINIAFPSIFNDLRMASEIKGQVPHCKTIVFGIFSTLLPKEVFKINPDVDFAVVGEPEWAIKNLIEVLHHAGSLTEVRGIAYQQNDGEIIIQEQNPSENDINTLPISARDLLDKEKYVLPVIGKPFTLINVGRGCPYHCSYCIANAYYGFKFRKRTVEKIIEELEDCKFELGISNFLFWGESFTFDRDYAISICEGILKKNLNITWSTTSRVDTIDIDLLKTMKQAGCIMLGLGIESVSQEILDRAQKNITPDKSKHAIKLCRQVGIKSMGHFVFGLPGETEETAKETIKYSLKSGLDYCQFYCAVPYPGTALFEIAKNKGWIQSYDWSRYELTSSIMDTGSLTAKQAKGFRDQAYRRFYLRPSFLFRQMREVKALKSAITSFQFLNWIKTKKEKIRGRNYV